MSLQFILPQIAPARHTRSIVISSRAWLRPIGDQKITFTSSNNITIVEVVAFISQCCDVLDSCWSIFQCCQPNDFSFILMLCHPVTLYLGLSFTTEVTVRPFIKIFRTTTADHLYAPRTGRYVTLSSRCGHRICRCFCLHWLFTTALSNFVWLDIVWISNAVIIRLIFRIYNCSWRPESSISRNL